MVYLIHFETPYKHAQHYLGYTGKKTTAERIAEHLKGTGSRLMQVVTQAGISWDVVRTWPDATRTDERKMKNRKNTKQLCPVCQLLKNKAI